MKSIINQIIIDNCMVGSESAMQELNKELRHALKKYTAGECSEKDYITMAARATAKFAMFMSKDTSANCEVVNIMRKIF